jgi:hypothetical protein
MAGHSCLANESAQGERMIDCAALAVLTSVQLPLHRALCQLLQQRLRLLQISRDSGPNLRF